MKKQKGRVDRVKDAYARLKIAQYLAGFIVVFGVCYFIYTRVIDPKESGGLEPIKEKPMTRNCLFTEDTCDQPCGRRVKTPDGKYCCLKGTC